MTVFLIKDFKFEGKRVLVRVDFNVPIVHGDIQDDTRILAALPTLKYILEQQPKQLIVMTHLGRPDGKVNEELRLTDVANRLSEFLGMEVYKTEDCIAELPENKVVILENLRFHEEEEKNDLEFAKKLASYADLFVNDAFGTAHRSHASNVGITKFLPSCAGLLIEKEIRNLAKARNPEHPYVAIIGGAKADKIFMLEQLEHKADKLLFGGVLANTLLRVAGKNIGASLFDEGTLDFATQLFGRSTHKIVLPIDAVVGKAFHKDAESQIVDIDAVPEGWFILDIGPKTRDVYKKELAQAKTITWTGPIGVFEFDQFAQGTKEIAEFLATLDATTIIGGGDSASAVSKFGVQDKMTHISTGGGASLEFLSGKQLPAIKALEENYEKFKNTL